MHQHDPAALGSDENQQWLDDEVDDDFEDFDYDFDEDFEEEFDGEWNSDDELEVGNATRPPPGPKA